MTVIEAKSKLAEQKKVLALATVAGLLLAILVFNEASNAQVTQGKERPLKTEQWMEAVHKVHCGAIKKGLKAGPSDDKAWKEIALHAAMMNESSYVLMADGRCPDGVWAGACKTLRAGSNAVLQAVEAKDVDAGLAAFGAMTKACGACHKAHKK